MRRVVVNDSGAVTRDRTNPGGTTGKNYRVELKRLAAKAGRQPGRATPARLDSRATPLMEKSYRNLTTDRRVDKPRDGGLSHGVGAGERCSPSQACPGAWQSRDLRTLRRS